MAFAHCFPILVSAQKNDQCASCHSGHYLDGSECKAPVSPSERGRVGRAAAEEQNMDNMGFLEMGVPPNGWFIRDNPHLKWMI